MIGLVTALEGYCKAKTGKKGQSFLKTFERLRRHAELDPELIGCRDDQLELLWHARNYYTHLGPQGGYSAAQLEEGLVDCCRIATALMQACLLRDLGFSPADATAVFEKHYKAWPLPSEKIKPANPGAPD